MIKQCLLGLLVLTTYWVQSQEPVDEALNTIIKKHGMETSKVMEIASWITDVYGPRLTGSPGLDTATAWAMSTLEDWGMDNVHLESWGPFGRGWQLDHFSMHMQAPTYAPIIAYPKAWSGSSAGPVEGEVIYLNAADEAQLAKFEGKLEGKFVLLDTTRQVEEWFEAPARRYDDGDLLSMANKGMPTPRRGRGYQRSGARFGEILWSFLEKEAPLAVIDRSYKGDLGTVFVSGARTSEGQARDEGRKVVPQVTMSIEHYNRIFRMLKKGLTVRLSMDLQAQYTNPDLTEHNIIAEIPGTDLKDEIVMFGAHFDSWHAATGATDNGAGSAVMMEVARILLETIKESGVQPRRTLRLALWTGEEQGLYGSRAYVREHYAKTDRYGNPSKVYPAQETVSAYYNLDNGTGRIRGVYLQGNDKVAAIFRSWLEPFTDLEAQTLTLDNTGGTDHLAFDAVGIPGFQFIQDPIAYSTRTHHSNMDNFDHLIEEDLQQAATIIASFVWHTAQRQEKIPRKDLEEILN